MAAEDWSAGNVYCLAVMTASYVVGEISHFLISTSSRSVAREVHYGDRECYPMAGINASLDCSQLSGEDNCTAHSGQCFWDYNGRGIQYQLLAGPSFVVTFTVFSVLWGFSLDFLTSSSSFLTRPRLMSAGVALFSASTLLMGLSSSFWQLFVLRMAIAAGESACRPAAGAVIADIFSPSARGIGNGIFSWGVYYGYGLAFVLGIYLTEADVLSFGWRATFVLSSLPGLVLSLLLFATVRDRRSTTSLSASVSAPPSSQVTTNHGNSSNDEDTQVEEAPSESAPLRGGSQPPAADVPSDFGSYLRVLSRSFLSPAMLLLLLAACFRHTAGYSLAYNTRLFFQKYYPDFDLGLWVFGCSVGGGSFGVFFGGYASDKLVGRLGTHSRLWVLSACTVLAVPFAVAILYVEPPYTFVCLLLYYVCSETWFAILFTVIVEVSAPSVRSTCIGAFLFVMNNVGGNLPVVVEPLAAATDYRIALLLVIPGCLSVSAVLFFVASCPLWRRSRSLQQQN